MPYISYLEKGIKKYFKLPDNKMAIFGREEHADFQIVKDSLVSREHFGIRREENGHFIIIDLGSSNGTFLNGKRLESNEVTPLKDNDKIKIGKMELEYREHLPKKINTTEIFQQVSTEYQRGKGYNTILREIVSNTRNKK